MDRVGVMSVSPICLLVRPTLMTPSHDPLMSTHEYYNLATRKKTRTAAKHVLLFTVKLDAQRKDYGKHIPLATIYKLAHVADMLRLFSKSAYR